MSLGEQGKTTQEEFATAIATVCLPSVLKLRSDQKNYINIMLKMEDPNATETQLNVGLETLFSKSSGERAASSERVALARAGEQT